MGVAGVWLLLSLDRRCRTKVVSKEATTTVQVRMMEYGLAVSGELDMAAADDFRMFAATAVDPTREVVLDLTDLEFIDSAGLRSILRLADSVCPHGLVLRWPQDNVLRALDLLGVETIAGIRVERRQD